MKFTSAVFLCLALVLLSGCSRNIKVSGKVTFSDGSPLTSGTVFFENSNGTFRGALQLDGTYAMGGISEKDGVPKGSYQVYIADAHIYQRTGTGSSVPVPLVEARFTRPSDSGLTCDVPGGKYDFVVERPAK